MHISTPTAMDAWKAALHTIVEKGKDFTDDDGRTCREILNLTITITHPDVGSDEPIDMMTRINKWFYPPKEELINIIFNHVDLPLYGYTYGSRLFGYKGSKDQINSYVIPLLKKNPKSRRAISVFVDPEIDLELSNRDAPSLISIHFKIEEDKLLATCLIRSNDFFIGWPANMFQIATLQEYVAQELEIGVGALTTYSLSAHIFAENLDEINKVLGDG